MHRVTYLMGCVHFVREGIVFDNILHKGINGIILHTFHIQNLNAIFVLAKSVHCHWALQRERSVHYFWDYVSSPLKAS